MIDAATEASVTRPQPALGRRIKALRLSRGLTLREVAAETGLSSSYLSLVETGRNEPTIGRLLRLAAYLEVGLGDLIPERDRDQPAVLRRGDHSAFAVSVPSGELMIAITFNNERDGKVEGES